MLTGNIIVPAGMNGLQVTASDVLLDLNGFTIAGPVTCAYNTFTTCSQGATGVGGVVLQGSEITVRGGTIRGFAGTGLSGSGGGYKFIDLVVTQNAGTGVAFNASTAAMLDRVHVTLNGGIGMACANGLVTNSSIEANGADGIAANTCSVVDSVIRSNKGIGLKGHSLVRGTRFFYNGTNKSGSVFSGGGNLDNSTLF